MKKTRRPSLREMALNDAMAILLRQKQIAACVITMSVGQWDSMLQDAYSRGWILLELNDDEIPVAAYQRLDPSLN